MKFRYERTDLAEDLVLWETFGAPTPAEWAECLAQFEEWLTEAERRGQRLRLLLDPSGMTAASPENRRQFSQWRARNLALLANAVACAAYVADSALMRGVLTAAFWFAPPVVPVQLASSRAEASFWLEQQHARLSAAPRARLAR